MSRSARSLGSNASSWEFTLEERRSSGKGALPLTNVEAEGPKRGDYNSVTISRYGTDETVSSLFTPMGSPTLVSDPNIAIESKSDTFKRSLNRASSTLSMNRLRFSNGKLYGRDKEVQVLANLFAAAENDGRAYNKRRQLAYITGSAGVGKSAVAQQLEPLVVREAGFFLVGKVDQQDATSTGNSNSAEPYAVFTMICRNLCDLLLAHKADPNSKGNKWQFTFEDVQSRLRQELEDVTPVLITVFPDLTQILGGSYLLEASNNKRSTGATYKEAKSRFNYAFCRLLRVLSTFARIVILMDDLQWAGNSSIELLKTLLMDSRQEENGPTAKEQGILVLATARSDEIDEHHPLNEMLAELEGVLEPPKTPNTALDGPELSLFFQRICVCNMTVEHINAMLEEMLNADTAETTRSLAECVYNKTQGNALYVVQFLSSLAMPDGKGNPPLLSFKMTNLKWEWDVEEIHARASATSNVAEMILQKLRNLPIGVSKILPVIASLGASFELTILHKTIDLFNKELFADTNLQGQELEPGVLIDFCEKEGILIPLSKRQYFKWQHDKVQESALLLAEPDKLKDLQRKLGEFLLDELDEKGLDLNIFSITRLLDSTASALPNSCQNRIVLAELNMKAGEKAMSGAAFLSASHYLARGIQLLPENHWEDHYRLSLALFSSAAEAHFCAGKVDEGERYAETVCALEKPILDTTRAYMVQIECIHSRGQLKLVEEKTVELLKLLGSTFPKYGRILYTISGVLKIKSGVKALLRDVPLLPAMTDKKKQHSMVLLDKLATVAYQNESDFLAPAILKGLHYTLKYGVSEYSPPNLTTVGLLLSTMGDLDGSNKVAEMSVALYDRPATDSFPQLSRRTLARTLHVGCVFCMTWQTPNTQLRRTLFSAYKAGLAAGDLESAFWAICCYLDIGFFSGLPLKVVHEDCKAYTQQAKDLNQDLAFETIAIIWQSIPNLMGLHNDSSVLDSIIARAESGEVPQGQVANIWKTRIYLAFGKGDCLKICEIIEESKAHKGFFHKAHLGLYSLPPIIFYCAIASFIGFEQTKRRKYLKWAKYFSRSIFGWAKKGNPNVVHYVPLLRAESAARRKSGFAEAVKDYKEAILLAGRQGVLHECGLSHERLGNLYFRSDLMNDSRYHLNEAVKLYREWGSAKRAELVLSRSELRTTDQPEIKEVLTSTKQSLDMPSSLINAVD